MEDISTWYLKMYIRRLSCISNVPKIAHYTPIHFCWTAVAVVLNCIIQRNYCAAVEYGHGHEDEGKLSL